jgi:hypothetical protein
VPTAEFDPDQLERLMVAAFELLGKPQGQARELSRAILKAAERPVSATAGPSTKTIRLMSSCLTGFRFFTSNPKSGRSATSPY